MAAIAVLPPAAGYGRTRDLWATVNVCDTKAHPNMMGVRARMPGDGTREHMYMRFIAQYHARDGWHTVAKRGTSKWLYAGSALFRNEEIGFTFKFDAPPSGQSYLMRGLVRFQWRKRRNGRTRVVHRTHAYTSKGHPSSGADPRRYSRAFCRIR